MSRLVLILLAVLVVVPLQAQENKRGPSTAEERVRALKAAKLLREAPLDNGTQAEREWLIKWLIEVPDISISLCGGLTGDLGKAKTGHPGSILASMMAGQAAYVIEHPDKAGDANAAYLAGIEAALATYKAIREKDPEFKAPGMDELLQKQEKGQLESAVKERAASKCK